MTGINVNSQWNQMQFQLYQAEKFAFNLLRIFWKYPLKLKH